MIREAVESDLNALLELYLHLHERSVPDPAGPVAAAWQSILRDPNHHVLLLEEEGRLVSSCVVVVIPNLTRNGRPYALVENVVTRQDCRRRGYAGMCLDEAKRIAREAGCYKIMLLTGSKDPSTHRFYQQAGYNSEDKTAYIQWL